MEQIMYLIKRKYQYWRLKRDAMWADRHAIMAKEAMDEQRQLIGLYQQKAARCKRQLACFQF